MFCIFSIVSIVEIFKTGFCPIFIRCKWQSMQIPYTHRRRLAPRRQFAPKLLSLLLSFFHCCHFAVLLMFFFFAYHRSSAHCAFNVLLSFLLLVFGKGSRCQNGMRADKASQKSKISTKFDKQYH